MTARLSDAALEALGLDPWRVGEPVRVGWPADAVAHGSGVRAMLTIGAIIASQYAGLHFAEVRAPFLEGTGVRLHRLVQNPDFVRITMAPGVRPEVRTRAEQGEAWALDNEAVVLLLSRTGPVQVTDPTGSGIALEPGPRHVDVAPVYAHPITVPSLAEIESPAAEWVAESENAWLRAEVERRLLHHDPWQHAVAVGLFARFAGAEEPARVVASVLRGEVDRDLARPRLWARGLSADRVRTIRLLAGAEMDRVHGALDDLERSMACDDPGWFSELLDACRSRDELEGVRLLVAEAGGRDEMTLALDVLDVAGRDLMASLPVRLAMEDGHLRRARQLDPDAWWVMPVTEPPSPEEAS